MKTKEKNRNDFIENLQKEETKKENYSEVMKNSYISYAMSVIISRAIPDVRDGLKPVHRRILYDMEKLGLDPDKATRKSARIVGDTMGKYHPHGDSSIYEALAAMTRGYKENIPLIKGQGNFGSPEGDQAAAMRYTEAKLENYSKEILLDDLDQGTVDFKNNYDDEEVEPEVLPAKLPQLLINGTNGVAVGVSTNILPHNVSEVIDANIYGLSSKNPTLDGYLKHIQGPDFPSSGYILNKKDMKKLYATGEGTIENSGKIEVEKLKNGKVDLVISQIPYTMIGDSINKFIEKVREFAKDGTLSDIVEIKNESDKTGTRIVLTTKSNPDIDYIKSVLYNKTDLKVNIKQNFLVIENKKPKIMNLVEYFSSYITFQKEIYQRKYLALLKKSNEKFEILSGLIKAVDLIDVIIAVIRGSKSTKEVKNCLIYGNVNNINFKNEKIKEKARKLSFTESQASAILNMKLSKLVGLEIDELKNDYDNIKKDIDLFKLITEDENELIKIIKKDLRKFKKTYGKERKTTIIDKDIEVIEKEIPEEKRMVLIDYYSYIHSVTENVYENNKENINKEYKYVIHTTNKKEILVFTDTGLSHAIKVENIPVDKYDAKGIPVDDISNFDLSKENIVGAFENSNKKDIYLVFLLSNGNVKKVDINEFSSSRKTVKASNLPENTKLSKVIFYEENKNVIIKTDTNKFIRFKSEEIPTQKKNSIGVRGIKVEKNEKATSIGFYELMNDSFIYRNKEIPVASIRLKKRGNSGIQF